VWIAPGEKLSDFGDSKCLRYPSAAVSFAYAIIPPEYVAPCQHTPPALHSHCMRSLFRNSSPSLGTSFLHTLPQRYAPPEVSSSTGVYTPPARGSLSLLCVCSLQGVPLRLSLSLFTPPDHSSRGCVAPTGLHPYTLPHRRRRRNEGP